MCVFKCTMIHKKKKKKKKKNLSTYQAISICDGNHLNACMHEQKKR